MYCKLVYPINLPISYMLILIVVNLARFMISNQYHGFSYNVQKNNSVLKTCNLYQHSLHEIEVIIIEM